MTPPRPFAKVIIAAVAAVTIQSCPLRGQELPPWVAKTVVGPPGQAVIAAHATPNGDLELIVSTQRVREPFDEEVALRQSLGCDWKERSRGLQYVSGTCRRFFHGHTGLVQLAPLVAALRGAGVQRVEASVTVGLGPGLSAESVAGWRMTNLWDRAEYRFVSLDELPQALPVQVGPQPHPDRLGLALLFLALVPAAAKLALRYFTSVGGPAPVLVWMSWIQLAIWLVWLTAVPPSHLAAFVAYLPIQNLCLSLLSCTALYTLPPLGANAACLTAFRRQIEPQPPLPDSWLRFLKRRFLPEATLVLLFGFMLMGIALMHQDWRAPLAGLAAGCLTGVSFRLQTRLTGAGKITTLEGGEFRDRTMQIAGKAGVAVSHIRVSWNPDASQANAMALPRQRQILVTEGLLQNLTKRETDGVMAHEIGHLRDFPVHLPPKLYWTIVPIYGAFAIFPFWGLPGYPNEAWCALAALALLFLAAAVSRRREFRADARAVAVTGDSCGMIAALGRVTKLRQSPTAWGRFEGSILSHPPLRARALALARRFGTPEEFALALAENPDLLQDNGMEGEARHYEAAAPQTEPKFSGAAKTVHLARTFIASQGILIFLVLAVSYLVTRLLPDDEPLDAFGVFLLSLPLVAWVWRQAIRGLNRRFLKQVLHKIDADLPTRRGQVVCLWPGDTMSPVQGFLSSDIGRVFANGDGMVYVGERTRFRLPRKLVCGIDGISEPVGWSRAHGILVNWDGGCFALRPVLEASRRKVAEPLRHWQEWWRSEATADPEDVPGSDYPLPDLSTLPAGKPQQARPIGAFLKQLALLYAAAWAVAALLPDNSLKSPAVFAIPVIYAAVALKTLFRSRTARPTPPAQRRVRNPVTPL